MNKFRTSFALFVAVLMVAPAIAKAADPTVPGVIGSLATSLKSPTAITLTWSQPTDTGSLPIDDYLIQYKVSGGAWGTYADGTSSSTTTRIYGLNRGTSYFFRVAAVNAMGEGAYVELGQSVLMAIVPPAPVDVRVSGSINPSAYQSVSRTVSWSAFDNGGSTITDYQIQYSSDGTNWTTFNDGVSTNTSVNVLGLTRGTRYTFRVAAINSEGTSEFSRPRVFNAGEYHNCELRQGVPYCWGYNAKFQTGRSTSYSSYSDPGLVTSINTGIDLAGGSDHTCSLLSDQTIVCWGNNAQGQLGRGGSVNTNNYGPTVRVTERVSNLPLSGVVQISSGLDHLCALTKDAFVYCWGTRVEGQVAGDGINTLAGATTAIQAPTLRDIKQISAGGAHTCALTYTGTVFCWGNNSQSQLGDGTYVNTSTPVQVAGLTDVKQISAGGAHTCALLVTNVLKCWGYNNYGQFGDGTQTSSTSPVPASGLSGITDVYAVDSRTCARNATGLYCWGSNYRGKIGNGVNGLAGSAVVTPFLVSGVANGYFSGGWEHSCSASLTGYLACWGWNSHNQVDPSGTTQVVPLQVHNSADANVSSTTIIVTVPEVAVDVREVDHLETSARIAWTAPVDDGGSPITDYQVQYSSVAGTWNTFNDGVSALTSATITGLARGTTYNFRVAATNAIGTGAYSIQSNGSIPGVVPRPVRGLRTRRWNTGYRDASLSVSWKAPDDGGRGVTDYEVQYRLSGTSTWTTFSDGVSTTTSTSITGLSRSSAYEVRVRAINAEGAGVWALLGVDHLEAGSSSACVISSDAVTRCWGANGSGQLGDGTTTNQSSPTQTSFSTNNFTRIAHGSTHACAVDTRLTGVIGDVVCWGSNTNGQLGPNIAVGTGSQTPVLVLSNAIYVASGGNTACAVLLTGAVKCWGRNTNGQLGNSTTVDSAAPVTVQGISGAVQVSVGSNHACARLTTGVVQCWGANASGQLGNNSTVDTSSPVSASGVSTATDIDLGGNHSCAVLASGSVQCWGANASGQLGNSSNTNSSIPVSVTGVTDGTSVALGAGHTCVLTTTGDARCWGANTSGQLGDGSSIAKNAPVALGLYELVSISSGDLFTCVSNANSEVKCWGAGGSGQIGNGTTSGSQTATSVNVITAATAIVAKTTPDSPQSLTENSHSATTVTLSWNSPQDDGGEPVTDYQVEYLATSGNWTVFNDGVSTTRSVTVTGLTRGVSYQFRITALNAINSSSSDAISTSPYAVTTQIVPAVNPGGVQSLSISAVTASSVILVWSAPNDDGGRPITDYLIEYRTVGGNWGIFGDSISNATIAAVTSLTQGQAYEFRVSATSANGTGSPVQLSGTGIPATIADAPVLLNSQTVVSGTSVQVSWNAPYDGGRAITDYEIETNSGSGWTSFVDGVSTSTSTTVTGLTRGTVLRVRVRAINAIGASAYSYLLQESLTQIAPGRHGCAVGSSGSVWCWGLNSSGEVGDGTTTNRYEMQRVPRISNATKVAIGRDFTCALQSTGEVLCWGLNSSGQLGNATTTSSKVPVRVSGISSAIDLDAGANYACAVLSTGTVQCWGLNSYKQLGDGSAVAQSLVPVNVSGVSGVSKIATSQETACALIASNGSVQCWGRNDGYNAGTGTASTTVLPSYVKSSSSVAISGMSSIDSDNGADFFCGVNTSSATVCWGYNNVGQRGTGATSTSGYTNIPVSTGVSKVAVGSGHACVLSISAGGVIRCWGFNSQGQSSAGTSRTNVLTPTIVVASGATDVVAGEYVSCSSGSSASDLSCWGNNGTYGLQVSDPGLGGGPYSADLTRTAVITRDVPSQPSGLQTSLATQSSITLSWTTPSDNGGAALFDYVLETSVNGGSWTTLNDGIGTSTSFVHSGLVKGANYLYRVSAVNEGALVGSATTLGTAEYAATPPGLPTALSSPSHDASSVSLTWTAPTDDGGRAITDYVVEYLPSGGSWTTFADGVSTTAAATVTGLTKGASYSFRVSAVNAEGTGTSSSSISVIPAVVPGVVRSVTEGAHTATSVGLSWLAPLDNGGQSITDYVVDFKPSGGSWTRFNDGVSTTLSAVVTGLTQGTSYQFRVAAVTVEGEGSAVLLASSVIPRTVPGMPTGLVETSHTGTTVSLSWNAPSNNGGLSISDYVIEYKEVAASSWNVFNDGTSSSTSATVTGLNKGTKYVFRVSAVTDEGNGISTAEFSNPVSWGLMSCTVGASGRVWCSGAAHFGPALGNGYERVEVPGITNAIQVSVGGDHTCALLATGTVKCWGYNGWGELGNGTTTSSATPVDVSGLTNVVQVESGSTFACARKSDGTVWCWGNGDAGRNGIGTTTTVPMQLTGLGGSATDIATGATFTCAVVNSYAKCWGYPVDGQLGNPNNTLITTTPQIVRIGTTNTSAYYLTSVVEISNAAGSNFTCARKSDGTVWCWGNSAYGQAGSAGGVSTFAKQISGISDAVSISGASRHACALTSIGAIYCWGYNAGGMIGDGTRIDRATATRVVTGGATWVSTGHINSSALVNGRLYYWGDNDYGQQSRPISTDIMDDILSPTDQSSAFVSYSVPATLPGAPSFSSETHLSTSVTLYWNAPNDSGGQPITDYVVQYKLTSDTSWSTFADGTSSATSATVTGLTKGQQYDFRVAAVTVEGTGANSSTWSTTPSVVPGVVSGVSSPSHTSTTVTVSWSAPSDDGGRSVSDYIIEYQLGAGSWVLFADGTSTSTSATVTGLTKGSSYSFRVSAVNANGAGSSTSLAGIIPATVPASTAISSETHVATSVTLNWSAPVDNGGRVITDYVVQYKLSSDTTWSTFADGVSTSVASTVTALTRGQSYDFQVAAVNVEGTGTFGTGITAIPSVVPAVPTGLASPSHLSTSVDLTWTAPTDDGGRSITDYVVEYQLGTGTWSLFSDGVSVSTSATVTSLTRGSTYSFRVSAKNANGAGSAVVLSSIIPATVPAAPVIASMSAPVAGSSAVANFTAFDNGGRAIDQMQYRLDGGSWISATTWSATTVTISGLTNGQTYAVEIRAHNADGYGSGSNSSNVTPATTPTAPTVDAVNRPVEGSKLSVAFTAADGQGREVTSYQYSLNGSTWLNRADGQTTTSPLVISTGLTNGTSYSVQIRALNAQGAGAVSNSLTQVPGTVPSAPTVSRLEPSNGGLGVVFTAPASNGGLVVSNYEYSLNDGQTWIARSPSAITSPWIITGLTNGTSYSVLLRAVNAQGGGAASSSLSATPASLPSSPTISSVTRPVAGGSLSVDFVAPTSNGGAPITKYQYSVNGGVTWFERTDAVGPTTSPMLISSLVNGTSYQVTIRAANAQGSGVSSQIYMATPATVPSVPSSVSADTPVEGQSADIYFTTGASNGDAITGYEYSINNGTTWVSRSDGFTVESPISIDGLTNGTTYSVRIRAVNGQGSGIASASISVVPATVPDAPSIASLVVSEASFKVTVTPGNNGGASITGYAYSLDGGVSWGTWSSSLGNYKVVSATAGVTYSVVVRASNRQGNSSVSAPRNVRVGDPPDAQTTGAADVTSTTAQLVGRVTANYALTTVAIELSTTSDFSSDVRTISGGLVSPSASSTISVKAVDLREATTYFYRVVGTNVLGRTAGATISFDTLAPVGVSLEDGAEFIDTPNVQVNLSWPRGAIAAMLSNDGGFKTYTRVSLAKVVNWKLASTGNERLPKTVYVRYVLSDGSRSETFTDDIILDETDPTVGNISAKRVAGSTVNALSLFKAPKLPSVKLSVSTSDANSGLDHVEVKGGGKTLSFATSPRSRSVSVTITTSKTSVSVRSVDRAGNASKWKTVKLPK